MKLKVHQFFFAGTDEKARVEILLQLGDVLTWLESDVISCFDETPTEDAKAARGRKRKVPKIWHMLM